jgi:cysteine desulfurase
MTYLDHNASSTLRPEARLATEKVLEVAGNPSSVHRWGRAARSHVEEAREEVAKLLNARPQDVVFTSGGTEANALALRGAVDGAAETAAPITRIYVSAIEHDSVLRMGAAIADRKPAVSFATIPVTRDGVAALESLRALLCDAATRPLVAIMAANNETGVIQPVAESIALVHDAGGLVLVDAVQACGKIALDFAACGADYLTVSAHKMGGPQGIGALVIRDDAPFAAQLVGGGQERYRRAGTQNVAAIAGFGAAARVVNLESSARLASLRDRFESGLRERFADVVIFGEVAPRVWNTSNFALPRITAETALIALDLDGVMVSSGAACSSGKITPSHVLNAMGVPRDLARSALRVSLGWNSTQADVEAALASFERLSARVTGRRAA